MQVLTKAVSSYFNSQPREGGWRVQRVRTACRANFNSQPREGGWSAPICRPPASIDFNSQPREGGWLVIIMPMVFAPGISTHSRAKAAGLLSVVIAILKAFQLTAARRRLVVASWF